MKYAIDHWRGVVFKAGQVAPAGRYVRVDRDANRVVTLERVDVLPATMDGHVAEYVRLDNVVWPFSRG